MKKSGKLRRESFVHAFFAALALGMTLGAAWGFFQVETHAALAGCVLGFLIGARVVWVLMAEAVRLTKMAEVEDLWELRRSIRPRLF